MSKQISLGNKNCFSSCTIPDSNIAATVNWTPIKFTFDNIDSIIPAERDLDLCFGKETHKCEHCTFEGQARKLIVHYFQECKGCLVHCKNCHLIFSRADLFEHTSSSQCLASICNEQDCTFRLFPEENKSANAMERRKIHSLYHRRWNLLKEHLSNLVALLNWSHTVSKTNELKKLHRWCTQYIVEMEQRMIAWREITQELTRSSASASRRYLAFSTEISFIQQRLECFQIMFPIELETVQ